MEAISLIVVNFLSEGNVEINETYNNISIESVINYLKNAHTYFLDYKLPSIRTKLLDAVDSTAQSSSYKVLFMKFFDEYFDEVRKHMEYEDKTVCILLFHRQCCRGDALRNNILASGMHNLFRKRNRARKPQRTVNTGCISRAHQNGLRRHTRHRRQRIPPVSGFLIRNGTHNRNITDNR